MNLQESVLIIPPNDAEAVMIKTLADAISLPMILSNQPHGAHLDEESGVIEKIHDGGWEKVFIVEMPGPKTEAKIRRLGKELHIIDHHHYTDLDRAHDIRTGKLLPSSLEQFLDIFDLTDDKLTTLGFESKVVRGVGIMDRGFVWALRDEGYNDQEVQRVLDFQDELMAPFKDQEKERQYNQVAKEVWEKRVEWETFFIVESDTDVDVRPRISLIVALELKKPTSIIFHEKKRRLLYVQESDFAMDLFQEFGGFTFGLDRNWGYQNKEGIPEVSLENVKNFLKKQ